jgi:nicotinamide-nucleotide amidase
MNDTLGAALDRADVVLTSGGLGPTEDDVTRECVAELLGRPLVYREDLFETLRRRFERVGRPLTPNNRKQAFVPEGGEAIPNDHGTAPGILVDDPRGVVVCMPGVPSELKPMMEEQVVPWIRERFGLAGALRSRVLKVCGLGESRVDDLIGHVVRESTNPTVGMLANPEWVRIRISARADTAAEAEALIEPKEAEIRRLLPGLIMGTDGDTLEGVLARLFRDRDWTLAIDDGATAGLLVERMVAAEATPVAAAEVRPVGSGSGDVAERAEAARRRHGTACGLGLAGGDDGCRVVFRSPEGEAAWDLRYGSRSRLARLRTAVMAAELLRRHLTGVSDEAVDPRS